MMRRLRCPGAHRRRRHLHASMRSATGITAQHSTAQHAAQGGAGRRAGGGGAVRVPAGIAARARRPRAWPTAARPTAAAARPCSAPGGPWRRPRGPPGPHPAPGQAPGRPAGRPRASARPPRRAWPAQRSRRTRTPCAGRPTRAAGGRTSGRRQSSSYGPPPRCHRSRAAPRAICCPAPCVYLTSAPPAGHPPGLAQRRLGPAAVDGCLLIGEDTGRGAPRGLLLWASRLQKPGRDAAWPKVQLLPSDEGAREAEGVGRAVDSFEQLLGFRPIRFKTDKLRPKEARPIGPLGRDWQPMTAVRHATGTRLRAPAGSAAQSELL